MLRIGILSSVIPLVLAGGIAQDWSPDWTHDWTHAWSSASARQCSAAGLAAPDARSIAFTNDPLAATVKVQLVDRAELADLAIADDIDVADAEGCGIGDVASSVLISAHPLPGAPVVYLSREADADYRIYVDSAKISAQQAAALLVGARGGHTRLASQRFDTTGSISR